MKKVLGIVTAAVMLFATTPAAFADQPLPHQAYQSVPKYFTAHSTTAAGAKLYQSLPKYQSGSGLSPVAKAIYQHLQAQDTTFTIHVSSMAQLNAAGDAFKAAMGADDYIHYIISGYGYDTRWSSNGTYSVTFTVGYLETKTQTAYVETQVQKILGKITTPSMNDFQKEKAIHDWIVSNIAYDTTYKEHSAYAALAKGHTVCQGFALLTYRMMTDEKIPTHIVTGVAGGGLHAWNEVEVGGSWYQLDTTWDDPVPFQKGRVLYSYFNLTDTQMAQDHQWSAGNLPAATTDFATAMTQDETTDPQNASVYAGILQAVGLDGTSSAASDASTAPIDSSTALNSDNATASTGMDFNSLNQLVQQSVSDHKKQIISRYHGDEQDVDSLIFSLFSNTGRYGVSGINYTYSPVGNGDILLKISVSYR